MKAAAALYNGWLDVDEFEREIRGRKRRPSLDGYSNEDAPFLKVGLLKTYNDKQEDEEILLAEVKRNDGLGRGDLIVVMQLRTGAARFYEVMGLDRFGEVDNPCEHGFG